MSEAPSLPKIRKDLKTLMAGERDAERRSDIGRALKAIERAESKSLDKHERS